MAIDFFFFFAQHQVELYSRASCMHTEREVFIHSSCEDLMDTCTYALLPRGNLDRTGTCFNGGNHSEQAFFLGSGAITRDDRALGSFGLAVNVRPQGKWLF